MNFISSKGVRLIDFIGLADVEIKMILEWRNNNYIRINMINSNIISEKEHVNFFNSLKENKTINKYFLACKNDIYIGVVSFNDVFDVSASVNIGLYSNPNLRKNGVFLLSSICEYCFNEIKCKNIIIDVLTENSNAISFYIKYGFIEIDNYNIDGRLMKKMEIIYANWK